MPYNNPCSGSIGAGPLNAALTALGAAINDKEVSNEALTTLVGGAITGAAAGALSCLVSTMCTPDTTNASFTLKAVDYLLHTTIELAGWLTAPLMGKLLLHNDNDWGQTIVDGIIGSATVTAGMLTLAGVSCCAYQLAELAKNTTFFRREDAPRNRPTRPADQAVTDIEAAKPVVVKGAGTVLPTNSQAEPNKGVAEPEAGLAVDSDKNDKAAAPMMRDEAVLPPAPQPPRM